MLHEREAAIKQNVPCVGIFHRERANRHLPPGLDPGPRVRRSLGSAGGGRLHVARSGLLATHPRCLREQDRDRGRGGLRHGSDEDGRTREPPDGGEGETARGRLLELGGGADDLAAPRRRSGAVREPRGRRDPRPLQGRTGLLDGFRGPGACAGRRPAPARPERATPRLRGPGAPSVEGPIRSGLSALRHDGDARGGALRELGARANAALAQGGRRERAPRRRRQIRQRATSSWKEPQRSP
jgi:hypothetical protein